MYNKFAKSRTEDIILGTLIVLMLWIGCNMGIEILAKKIRKIKKQKRRPASYKKGVAKDGWHTTDNIYGDFMDFQMSA